MSKWNWGKIGAIVGLVALAIGIPSFLYSLFLLGFDFKTLLKWYVPFWALIVIIIVVIGITFIILHIRKKPYLGYSVIRGEPSYLAPATTWFDSYNVVWRIKRETHGFLTGDKGIYVEDDPLCPKCGCEMNWETKKGFLWLHKKDIWKCPDPKCKNEVERPKKSSHDIIGDVKKQFKATLRREMKIK